MRNVIIVAVGLGCAACGGEVARVDTATSRDSNVVAGPPATPSPPAESATTTSTRPAPSPNRPQNKTGAPPAAESKQDSVRGIVSVVGTSFDKHVMIAVQGTQRRIEVVGSLSSLIGHVAGTEVSAAGAMSGTKLDANRFVVRSVDGQPAIDGILKAEGGSLFIVTDGTRTRIAAPPPPLVGHDGARVWITGDPAKAVSSFGFIDPPR